MKMGFAFEETKTTITFAFCYFTFAFSRRHSFFSLFIPSHAEDAFFYVSQSLILNY